MSCSALLFPCQVNLLPLHKPSASPPPPSHQEGSESNTHSTDGNQLHLHAQYEVGLQLYLRHDYEAALAAFQLCLNETQQQLETPALAQTQANPPSLKATPQLVQSHSLHQSPSSAPAKEAQESNGTEAAAKLTSNEKSDTTPSWTEDSSSQVRENSSRQRARSTLTIELASSNSRTAPPRLHPPLHAHAHSQSHRPHLHSHRRQDSQPSILNEEQGIAQSSDSADDSDRQSSHSPASASVPMIIYHDDECLNTIQHTRPISLSHAPNNYSYLPQAQRLMLANYHNAIAACLIHIYTKHQSLPLIQAASTNSSNALCSTQLIVSASNRLNLEPNSPTKSPVSSYSSSASHAFVSTHQREAKQHLYTAIDLSADEAYPYYNLAVLQCHRREFEAAVKTFRLALKKLDTRSTFHSNLGYAYLEVSEYNKALSAFAKAIAVESTPAIIYNLATGCIKKKKWREAITYLKRAIELTPKSASAFSSNATSATSSSSPSFSVNDQMQEEKSFFTSTYLLSLLYCQLAYCYEQSSLWNDCIKHSTLSLSISTQALPKALRHRAISWAAQNCYLQAIVDAKFALQCVYEQKSLSNKREFTILAEELVNFMKSWHISLSNSSSSENDTSNENPAELLSNTNLNMSGGSSTSSISSSMSISSMISSNSSNNIKEYSSHRALHSLPPRPSSPNIAFSIPLSQHHSILETTRQEYLLEIEKLKAEVRALNVNPNAPSQESKMMAIMCVICLAQQRSQLFIPCNHLLCCEACGQLVRACPFCKKTIRKRKGPIYL